MLTAVGVPAGDVGDVGSAIEHARALGLDPTVDVGPARPHQVRHPIRWSRSTPRPAVAPPSLGEHNEEIRHLLGGEKRTA